MVNPDAIGLPVEDSSPNVIVVPPGVVAATFKVAVAVCGGVSLKR